MVRLVRTTAQTLYCLKLLIYLVFISSVGYLFLNYSRGPITEAVIGNNWQSSIDFNASSTNFWIHDEECQKFQTHFAKPGTFKPRALVSYSGSGNSWLRYLIECSTGIFTGSLYRESRIYDKGLLGEYSCPEDGTTIVQKTHDHSPDTILSKCRQKSENFPEDLFTFDGILIIRNPYDSIISNWNLKQSNDQRGYANLTTFSQTEWRTFAINAIPRWSSIIIAWMTKSQGRMLIVEYEKLKANPRKTLIHILHYFKRPVQESRLDCLMKSEHIEGPFHRQQKIKSVKTATATISNSKYYPMHIHDIVQEHITRINTYFSRQKIPILLNYKGPSN